MLKFRSEDKSATAEPERPWEATDAEREQWLKARSDLRFAKELHESARRRGPQGPQANYDREVVDASTREQLARHRLLGVEAKIRRAAGRRLDPIAQLEG